MTARTPQNRSEHDFCMGVKDALKDAVFDTGVNLRQLALANGLCDATLYLFVNGGSTPNLLTLFRYCDLMGIKLSVSFQVGDGPLRKVEGQP